MFNTVDILVWASFQEGTSVTVLKVVQEMWKSILVSRVIMAIMDDSVKMVNNILFCVYMFVVYQISSFIEMYDQE